MNDKDITRLLASSYTRTEDPVASLHWKDRTTQLLRLELLCQFIPEPQESTFSILDAGCGLGDLLPSLQSRWPNAQYLGIDVVPSFIHECKLRYPTAAFQLADILDIQQPFDYTVVSGTFNEIPASVTQAQFRAWVWRRISHLWELSHKGLLFNGISDTQIKWRNPKNLYWNIGELAAKLAQWTRFFVIRHDYPLYEFTVALYRPQTVASIFGHIGDWR